MKFTKEQLESIGFVYDGQSDDKGYFPHNFYYKKERTVLLLCFQGIWLLELNVNMDDFRKIKSIKYDIDQKRLEDINTLEELRDICEDWRKAVGNYYIDKYNNLKDFYKDCV